jgi:hypothetical protein
MHVRSSHKIAFFPKRRTKRALSVLFPAEIPGRNNSTYFGTVVG